MVVVKPPNNGCELIDVERLSVGATVAVVVFDCPPPKLKDGAGVAENEGAGAAAAAIPNVFVGATAAVVIVGAAAGVPKVKVPPIAVVVVGAVSELAVVVCANPPPKLN